MAFGEALNLTLHLRGLGFVSLTYLSADRTILDDYFPKRRGLSQNWLLGQTMKTFRLRLLLSRLLVIAMHQAGLSRCWRYGLRSAVG